MDTNENEHGRRPPFAILSRYAPLAAILVLLLMLLPQLFENTPANRTEAGAEPPLALIVYQSGYMDVDSLANEGLKSFNRKDWDRAVRFLGEARFHWSVLIREKMEQGYPVDLRFYLGLSHYYRGLPAKGIPLLEEEIADDPTEAKYHWYIAHLSLAAEDTAGAREHFERAVTLGGNYADEAKEKLERLDGANE
jgi:tetratricopeptide (TPR) repeat protein